MVYSSSSVLRTPGAFLLRALEDLRASGEPARHLLLKNLRGQHRQSVLGIAWMLLPSLATTVVWTCLNRPGILQIGKTTLPYPVYVLLGTVLWQVFVEALKCPIQELRNAGEILTKVRLPHEAVILSGVGSIVFHFAVRLLPLAPALWYYHIPLAWSVFLAPLGMLCILALGLAMGLWLAPFGLLYHDVSRGIDFAMGFGFLVTPIVYPVSPAGPGSFLDKVNPLVPILTSTRDWLSGGPLAPAGGFYALATVSCGALVLGWLFYRVASPHLLARL